MLINIILFICFFPLPIIIYFILRNEAKPKKNIILGVTLPHRARRDDAVANLVKQYLTHQTIALFVLTALVIPTFFFKHESIVMTWYFIWFIFVIIIPFVLFGISNKNLKTLKQQNSWFGESNGLMLVDIKLALTPKKTLSVWLFVPPVIMSLYPLLAIVLTLRGSDEFWPLLIVYALFVFLSVSLYFIYRIIFHQKAEVVDESTSISAALTQVRRYNWGKCMLLTTWLTGLLSLVMWLFSGYGTVILIASLIYTVVLLVFIIRAEFRTRKIQQKLTEESGRSVYTDEDDHWLFGMFYNNPNDRHFMVNKRTGIGMTINLAGAAGKVLIVFCLLIIVSMPFLGLWMMREEFTPVTLEATETQVIAGHTSDAYTILFADIQTAYLLNELPVGTRTMGTGMDTVLKGRFRFEGIGACSVCLDPRMPPFIVVTTENGTYILGSSEKAQTLDVYNTLSKLEVAAVTS